MNVATDLCPGCAVTLPPSDGPVHRYMIALPACWALYTGLFSAGEPPVVGGLLLALTVDAYAAQHPGTPNPQAIQSVAVHLLTLHGIFARGQDPGRALWLRTRALRADKALGHKHSRFTWLTPPDFAGTLNVAAIAAAPTPEARGAVAERWVRQVYATWAAAHAATLAAWYDRYIEA